MSYDQDKADLLRKVAALRRERDAAVEALRAIVFDGDYGIVKTDGQDDAHCCYCGEHLMVEAEDCPARKARLALAQLDGKEASRG